MIAERVVRRYLRRIADSFGDPTELLKEYREAVTRYAQHEETAKNWLHAYREIQRLQTEGSHTKDEQERLRESHMIQRWGHGLERVLDKSGGPAGEVAYNGRSGYLGKTADRLCLAILQQLVLPPGIRRRIEASAKWWGKAVRQPHADSREKGRALEVELYLKHLDEFRKYEKVFEEAIRIGKAHSAEGEGATRMKAGPFTIVNTGGFSQDTMDHCATVTIDAAHRMQSIGLGKVCYGDMLITNKLLNDRNYMAFYSSAQDEMFIRPNVTEDAVRFVCHELTHRLVNKFLRSKEREIAQVYEAIKAHMGFSTEVPKLGETVDYDNKTLKVVDYDERRRQVDLVVSPPVEPQKTYTMPVAVFQRLQGKATDDLEFVTAYAKTGGPEENFCEMVSFYAFGKLPKGQLDLLLPILE